MFFHALVLAIVLVAFVTFIERDFHPKVLFVTFGICYGLSLWAVFLATYVLPQIVGII